MEAEGWKIGYIYTTNGLMRRISSDEERNKHLSIVTLPFRCVISPVILLKEYLTKWAIGDMGSGVTHSVLTGRQWKMDREAEKKPVNSLIPHGGATWLSLPGEVGNFF